MHNGLCHRSVHRVCYYFKYWWYIPPGFEFYVVTRSYSSCLFLCALAQAFPPPPPPFLHTENLMIVKAWI